MQISPEFIKRLKSLLWRLAMMVLAVVVDFLAQNLAGFNLSPSVTVVLGLLLGELSKYLNSLHQARLALAGIEKEIK